MYCFFLRIWYIKLKDFFTGVFILGNNIDKALESIYGNFTLLFFEKELKSNSNIILFCKRIDFEDKYSLFKYSLREDKINFIVIDISLREAILKFNDLINK